MSPRTIAGLLLLTWGAGCEQLEPYEPKVSFDRFDVKDIDFQRIDTDFVFNVDNPDPIDISLSSFSYDLGFEGIDLFNGSDEDGMTLDAVGTSELRLPVGFEWQAAWDTVQATKGEDFVSFFLNGDFGFNTPIGEAKIPYDEDGQFPAVRTPKLTFKKLRVAGIDWTGTAAVKLDFDVENEHASTLIFNNLDYDVALGGQHVGHGLIPQFGSVEGATTKTMTIPIDVNIIDVGSQVWQVLSGNGNLNVGLKATTDVDTPFGVLPLSIDQNGDVNVEQGG
jgi:LEA14-like dessication related protein